MSNANKPAFPETKTEAVHVSGAYGNTYSVGGLTKREYFAAMAMQGFAANSEYSADTAAVIATAATACADALFAELERTK